MSESESPSNAAPHHNVLARTPLDALHRELGARMVPFAGYELPIQYPSGILAEHAWTRSHAGLFDVSHMGQISILGPDPSAALERLVPGELRGLKPGRMRYTLFTNADGGILDDLMVLKATDRLFLVVNGANKQADLIHLLGYLSASHTIEHHEDRALLALQGPEAAAALLDLAPDSAELSFMSGGAMPVGGVDCIVTRSGYTGEDGFELSIPAAAAREIAERLLAHPAVKPIGLGARDSLRLEAGLCLHGHDIDATTNPIEADLAWAIPKRRREAADFPGAERILADLAKGPWRRRVGLLPEGRIPAREGTPILGPDGAVIGAVTSGGFGPTLGGPLAMGYVEAAHAALGASVALQVRGQSRPATIVATPFVPHRYHRG